MKIVNNDESFHALRVLFNKRYSEWALQDTVAQCKEGFPLLKLVKSSQVSCILRHLNSLSLSDRECLVRATWKQMDANLDRKAPELTDDESRLVQGLREALLNRWSEKLSLE